ncbi:autotransporter-associated beta strand repeat-containing protein, partial [Achromobacter ruhlandii]
GLTDTIVAGLQDVAANAATGWDGRSLTKQGAGALILTGENAYSGGTTIAAGTLQIGDGGTRGAVTGAIDNQGALVFDRSDDIIHAGRISGAGAVTKKGSNTLTLTGDNAYTGLTTIAGGALRVGAGGASGALAGDIAFTGAGDLIFDRSDASQYAGAITGAARLAKNGAGTLILSGDNLHTGGTRITGGTLQ